MDEKLGEKLALELDGYGLIISDRRNEADCARGYPVKERGNGEGFALLLGYMVRR